jgi:hypothetical protein
MGDTGDTDATPSAATAYRELADGLRELASTVSAGEPRLVPDRPVLVAEPVPAVEQATALELVRAGIRGAVEVSTCSALIALLLVIGFNLLVTINPPVRF